MCAAFNRRIAAGLLRNTPAILLNFPELDEEEVFEETPEWANESNHFMGYLHTE